MQPYQVRLLFEYAELKARQEKLYSYLEKTPRPADNDPPSVEEQNYDLLFVQLSMMNDLLDVLRERLKLMGLQPNDAVIDVPKALHRYALQDLVDAGFPRQQKLMSVLGQYMARAYADGLAQWTAKEPMVWIGADNEAHGVPDAEMHRMLTQALANLEARNTTWRAVAPAELKGERDANGG